MDDAWRMLSPGAGEPHSTGSFSPAKVRVNGNPLLEERGTGEAGGEVMLSGPKSTIRRARRLRKGMSLPEVLLWQQLCQRPGGLKFRRQQAAGFYVGDFYCHQAELLIEIDGEAHNRGNAPEWDTSRDLEIAKQGVRVLRIPAREVLHNMEGVLELIVGAAEEFTSPPSSGWSPSPQGEDC